MKPGQIKIPRSELGARLDETAAIKRRMAELLAELEARAKPPERRDHRPGDRAAGGATLGGWRHNPQNW